MCYCCLVCTCDRRTSGLQFCCSDQCDDQLHSPERLHQTSPQPFCMSRCWSSRQSMISMPVFGTCHSLDKLQLSMCFFLNETGGKRVFFFFFGKLNRFSFAIKNACFLWIILTSEDEGIMCSSQRRVDGNSSRCSGSAQKEVDEKDKKSCDTERTLVWVAWRSWQLQKYWEWVCRCKWRISRKELHQLR